MSAIQNIKNFIRHGKQAKAAQAEPATTAPAIHGQLTVPAAGEPGASHDAAAPAADHAPRKADIERLVAEERENRAKLPKYPGLERWTLIEKMGDGAFSNVYRAQDREGQYGEVAIKVVRKFEMNNQQGESVLHQKAPKTVERSNILKEVQIMKQLDHDNIVRLIDFHESRQYYFIVLELCPGGELFHQIVRLTYFSEELSRHIIVQVAEALEYLHETAGVVHRDIKPENLLFYPVPFIPSKNRKLKPTDEDDKADEGEFRPGVGAGGIGVIKIADFGLSKVIWDSQTMTPCGTVGYTAPEIVKDERYSKSVDMWALGCVLYTLLCGFPPFYDESIQMLTEKVARGQYTFLSPWWDDISTSAKDLISHLLTVDPDRRYNIRQFRDHPWIRNTSEPTTAAADAPPSVGLPLSAVRSNPQFAHLDDLTPGGTRRIDFRSPGAINLREVFDVGYAVHRQEEEGKRRKNFRQGFRGADLNALDEDEERDGSDHHHEFNSRSAPFDPNLQHIPAKLPRSTNADVTAVERQMRNATLSAAAQARAAAVVAAPAAKQPVAAVQQEHGYGQHSPAVAAAARRQMKNRAPFELSLDNATLLGRRGKKMEKAA